MLLTGLLLAVLGVAVCAWSMRPWGRTRAAWRGMTPDEAFRWDGAAPTELTMWLGRLGFVLVIVGVVLALVSIF